MPVAANGPMGQALRGNADAMVAANARNGVNGRTAPVAVISPTPDRVLAAIAFLQVGRNSQDVSSLPPVRALRGPEIFFVWAEPFRASPRVSDAPRQRDPPR
ncbi:MAG: hypothetical protein EA381_10580 [Planctomycetaceae bacterium]|nr:MAG: hypothetical protein EA381_10580 [Planctomycetaceae bacterium]